MKKYLFLTFILAVMINIQEIVAKGNGLGDFKSLDRKGQQFVFSTTNGVVRIWVYSPTIIRITVAKDKLQPTNPYSVILKPQNVDYKFENLETEFVIKTGSVVLRINKFPIRFVFETLNGEIINADDKLGTYFAEGEIYSFKKLFDDEKFVGLGEKTGHFNRRGSAFVNWNTDNPHYMNWDDPLYSSIPFFIGFHNGKKYGIYVDNTAKTTFNFGAGNNRFSYFAAKDSQLDYYFIYGNSVADIISEYSSLTGKIDMPPFWGLGFQQCRWSYTPDQEVLDVAKKFRHRKIPLDVIYLDIDYMDGYKVFTWHPENFSNPKKLVSTLKDMGIHTMVIIDPGIKIEKGYKVYDEGVKNNYFLKYPDDGFYEGEVWPGLCHFPDFTNPEVREWWGKQFKVLTDAGVTGFWNDMNEIAVWGKEVPDIVTMFGEGNTTDYAHLKNAYGMQMARATFEGTKKLMEGKRPLILTRSGFAGFQRYSAIWTGDNHATDEHMMLGIRMVNSLGLSGVPFAGYDVGGFNGDATKELYSRWVSLGAFSPFFRAHSAIGTKRAEPWSFGENAERIAKRFIRLRYNMLPYIYSLFYEAAQTGMPVQRSLVIDYSDDPRSFYYRYENQYMFGSAFLVAPSESKQKAVKVFLPEGKWYYFYDGKPYDGNSEVITECPLDKPAVFVKESSIIPIQKSVQNTSENSGDTLEIHVYNGDKRNSFTYYEDDGISYNYKKGNNYTRKIDYFPSENKIVFQKPKGNFKSRFKTLRIQFHGFAKPINKFFVNGTEIKKEEKMKNFLSNYQKREKDIISLSIPNENKKTVISWK